MGIGGSEGRRGRILLLVLLTSLNLACRDEGGPVTAQSAKPVRIAAAATLSTAFEALARIFEERTGNEVETSFGSSGLLAKQLIEGAPFDLFASADLGFVDEVVNAGVCDGKTRALYARGRIVVWARAGGVAAPTKLEELRDQRFQKIAIANPDTAPYGRAAREALQASGLWDRLEARLVYGENIRQTLQLAETGNAEAAIVSLALVTEDRANPWFLIDAKLHTPIDQALALCTRGGNRAGAEAFVRLLDSAEGRELMRRHGFIHPDSPGGAPP